MRRGTFPLLAALLLILCLAVSPASAADWVPPHDRSIVGVEWNASDPSPALRWIDGDGNTITPPNFDTHVVWGNVKKVLLTDDEVVIRDTNPRGDTLDMSGASGKVMTEIPKFYVASTNASTGQYQYYRWFISPDPAAGFTLHPAFVQRGGTERDNIYVGSYEATLRVLDDGTLALDSRSGEQPWAGYYNNPLDGMFKLAFDGGTSAPAIGATVTGNTSGTAGQVVDLYVASGSWATSDAAGFLVLKQTSGTFTNDEPLTISAAQFATADTPNGNAGIVATINTFEAAGEALGDGYGAMNVWSYSAIRMLHLIEYANWGSQETVGLGIVSKVSGTGFNGEITGYNSVDTNVNEYGTGTGTGTAGLTPASYRTMTDLWGNSWEWATGYTSTNTEYQIVKRDGTGSLSTHPLAAGSYESSEATPLGADGYVSGYWTSLFHEDLLQYQFIADSVTGGSQSTYGMDYQYSHNPGTRVLRAGGCWRNGRGAGLGGLNSKDAASSSYRDGGARLEFTGAATLNGAAPAAQYTQNASAGNAPFEVAFTDASTGAPGWWRWDFGDGTTSTDQNPTHTYTEPGTYTATMTAYTLYGEDTTTQTVEVRAPPAASFSQNATEGNAPLAVAFTDSSTGNVTGWSWAFGDGETSSQQHPTHVYEAAGTYTVTLNASNPYGFSLNTTVISVLAPPVAGFTANTTVIPTGSAVAFTDASMGNVTAWSWSFGDGETSSQQSPVHTYSAAGTYTVTLNASNPYGFSISTQTDYIDVGHPPVADFTTNVTGGNAPLTVQFSDTSTGTPTSWVWTFGDGETSTAQSPSHTYAAAGSYSVSLTATNAYGEDTETKTDHITVLTAPGASFTVNATEGNAPLTVAFTDTSTGDITGWAWTFGDGETSTAQSPSHTYAAPGTYTVTLNASNPYGYDLSTQTNLVTALPPPAASFTQNVTGGNAPLAVQFTDTSTGNVTAWSWLFGDGQTSTLQNPAHTYAAAGTYTVTLNASNAYGYDISTQTDLITVLTLPAAAFSANATVIPVGAAVQFTDASTGDITGWSWTFGDGETSTVQSPAHTYGAAGTYTVTLTATNAYGEDTETKTAYIDVGLPPAAAFTQNATEGNAPLTVQFTDTTANTPTAWLWTFGDGETSTLQSPGHTYAEPGTYTVTLTATNAYGEDTETKTDLITALGPPAAAFTTDVTGGNAPLTVQFTDTSTGDLTGWAWAFGDGETSTAQSPSHTYAEPGTYTVSLTVSNAYSEDTETKTGLITVLTPPSAAFSADLTVIPVGGTVQFTDASTGDITGWSWAFGDGETSTAQSPSHTYATAGLQTVSLTVSNAYGSDTETKTAYIDVGHPPVADFSPSATIGVVPAAITFTDTSANTPTAWLWAFGDGETSTAQNPVHTYATAGTYTVTLTATNAYGEDTETKTALLTVYDPVTANFTVDTAAGLVPLAVQFTDTSTGDPTEWTWAFGDGETSTLQNPTHTYSAEGNYTVTLTASNPADEDAETKTEYIKVFDPVTAAFTADQTLGLTPLTVRFTSTGTGTPAAWNWTFGDGATSTEQNPSHTYTAAGTYTVCLTVADGIIGENPPLTTDTATQTGLIAAYDPLVAGFSAGGTYGYIPFSVQFTDTSAGSPTAWHWDFGDGTNSTDQNPTHTYTEIGTYPVTLTVSHAADEQTETKAAHITADYPFAAAFTLNATSGVVPLVVQFTDTTPGTPVSRLWNFGDGKTSTEQNPIHVYTQPGTFDVSLTVYGIQTQNTRAMDGIVHAGARPTVAFSGTPTTGFAPLTVQFTAACQDATSYLWTFGDGTTSTQQHPSHTYAAPGTYTVTLTGTNAYGSTVTTKTDYVTATHVPPVASFTAAPTSGHAPVPVRFTDTSTNAPTAWHWDFGDGETSILRHPTHIYRTAGTYPVTLTVTNPGGSDAVTKTDLITIYAAGDPGYTARYPASDLVVTMAATGLGTQQATLNGELAAATATEVWFEYGTKSNSYGFTTAAVTAEPGSLISTPLAKFPLIAGQTYYYRLACADGYGAEQTFTLPALAPHPTTTYGAAADQFLYSFEDGDTMVQNMTEATWSPYVATLGSLFFGLVIGAIFLNLAMKGHSIAIPTMLVLIIGASLWAFVPPEFVIIAQAFVIMGIGGLVYYIYTKRKL